MGEDKCPRLRAQRISAGMLFHSIHALGDHEEYTVIALRKAPVDMHEARFPTRADCPREGTTNSEARRT